MRTYRIIIKGKPFAKQRARFARTGHAYTPKETVAFERVVGQMASVEIPAPLTGPVMLSVTAQFLIPKSWSKKKRERAMAEHYHTQKPDFDNIQKALSDGLNRIAWVDDCQVCSANILKIWDEHEAATQITITELTRKNG